MFDFSNYTHEMGKYCDVCECYVPTLQEVQDAIKKHKELEKQALAAKNLEFINDPSLDIALTKLLTEK